MHGASVSEPCSHARWVLGMRLGVNKVRMECSLVTSCILQWAGLKTGATVVWC